MERPLAGIRGMIGVANVIPALRAVTRSERCEDEVVGGSVNNRVWMYTMCSSWRKTEIQMSSPNEPRMPAIRATPNNKPDL